MNLSLDAADAMEVAQLLDLLRDWLTADHGQLSGSLERFIGSTADAWAAFTASLK